MNIEDLDLKEADVLANVALYIMQLSEKRTVDGCGYGTSVTDELFDFSEKLSDLAQAARDYYLAVSTGERSVIPSGDDEWIEYGIEELSSEEIDAEYRLKDEYYKRADKFCTYIDEVFRNQE